MAYKDKITKITIPACDKCGMELSDGGKSVDGYPNFYGLRAEIRKEKSRQIQAEVTGIDSDVTILYIKSFFEKEEFILCDVCAEKVRKFIKNK